MKILAARRNREVNRNVSEEFTLVTSSVVVVAGAVGFLLTHPGAQDRWPNAINVSCE